ncbi:MAG TPA: aconitate hydratase [Acidimicrobiales bacterium]|jgi:aconitate hydratase|nr:aconitate hydratase [Acidimicrobiales bacterium]
MAAIDARATLDAGGQRYEIQRLGVLEDEFAVSRLPYSLKVLLENLLRHNDGVRVTDDDVAALARWSGGRDDAADDGREISFLPARVLMQDFTGVPAVVDLAAMRQAVADKGGDPQSLDPLIPADLVIDHSVQVDVFGRPQALARNAELEYERNLERYQFLRWGQQAFGRFRVVPPATGICHQVNLEHLATVVATRDGAAFPDTLVGTDSHTPMVNGLGVVGWGVGGIEAEAALLGQPISMLIPEVVGFKLSGELPEGATATDLVLTVTNMLRAHGVVGRFVEFYGPGVANVPVENRATIGNMSPEYGSTITIFPVDDETLRYLRFTGRPDELVALVEAYAKEQGLWHDPGAEPTFTETLDLDLSTVEPCIAGPSRPQDRVPLREAKQRFTVAVVDSLPDAARVPPTSASTSVAIGQAYDEADAASFPASDPPAATQDGRHPNGAVDEAPDSGAEATGRPHRRVPVHLDASAGLDEEIDVELDHGHVAIAAITSCTNTSNPQVMVAAGLLARKAVERGLGRKPWVKTSLAPGSKVVADYLERAGLLPDLEKLGFGLVGFGCTTCIGNSGPLPPPVAAAAEEQGLALVSVLSGNRNFEGRINPDVRMNYLASPPLVVAYALAGTMDIDLTTEPLGTDAAGQPVMLADLWPTEAEVNAVIEDALASDMFRTAYGEVFDGDDMWRSLPVPAGGAYEWSDTSTYVRRPPYFDRLPDEPTPLADVEGARALAALGDSVTTDHISPAGAIHPDSPAGRWLIDQGVAPADFNSYGSRRGNHEVMIRGTFANRRIRNRLAPGTEGGVTRHQPSGDELTIYEAAERYRAEGVPLVVLAGKEYGSGSSRDWAAKGTALLGVKVVIAESFERIHRSNLIGMGVLPLQLADGATWDSLGIDGTETFTIRGLSGADPATLIGARLAVEADGTTIPVVARLDTPMETAYYHHGGILQYVLRQHLAGGSTG